MDNNIKPEAKHGKQNNQKMKPYLVMQYLLKNTDENNTKTAYHILSYLEECGIYAERRSIYRDIDEINKAMLMVENDIDIFEAEEWLEDDTDNEEKFIVYDKSKKGFYARRRNYDVRDIRLLAECVYSAKFLDKSQSEFLVDIVCSHVSKKQAETIKHDVLLTDRTDNAEVINSIATTTAKKYGVDEYAIKYIVGHAINDVTEKVYTKREIGWLQSEIQKIK